MAQRAPSHQKGPNKTSEELPLLSDDREPYHSTTTRSNQLTTSNHDTAAPASTSGASTPPSQYSISDSASIAILHSHNSVRSLDEPQPSWRTLPHKSQLLTLLLASLSSPLAQYSQTSYLFHQIHWFDPTLPSSEIALRAAYLTAAFAGAQCATALLWGTLADSERVGRKAVLMVGLAGSAIAAVGVGFVRSFEAAIWWRVLAGIMTGMGGVGRVVVAEIVGDIDEIGGGENSAGDIKNKERRREHEARAFLLLPICYNVGVIVGPLVGGLLADPMGVLGDVSDGGVGNLLRTFPFALPNLLFAVVFGVFVIVVVLGLNETHPRLRGRRDRGRDLGMWILETIHGRCKKEENEEGLFSSSSGQDDRRNPSTETTAVGIPPLLISAETHVPDVDILTASDANYNSERSFLLPTNNHEDHIASSQLPSPFRTILTTPNIMFTMLLRFLQSLHISAFYAIYTVLLPTPRSDPNSFHPPFFFSGGLGLSPQKMGLANTIIGMIGLPLQVMLYPYLVSRIGVSSSYAVFLPLSILAYTLLPFLILLPEDQEGLLWVSLCCVLSLQVLSRTFINPAGIMLVNDCAPSGEMLGSVHGLGVTVSSAAKIVGPLAGGAMLGWGLANGCVVVPLWVLGGVAGVNLGVLGWVGDVSR